MEKEPIIRLNWHGQETVDTIPALLDEAEQIQITLAPDYHHVLFRTLNPESSSAQWEELDVKGNPALLDTVSRIDGLEPLAQLTDELVKVGAVVHIESPATITIKMPGHAE